ncbi:MAG TPA: PKD domain-containing protein [Polyangia bacterium]|jgi:hypothetical protein
MSRRSLRILAIVVALGALVLLVFWRRRPPPPGPPAAAATEPAAAGEPRGAPGRPAVPPPSEGLIAGAPATPDPPPIIDDIIVEKPSVCAGEENLITVKAHTENNTNEHLHYVIDGELGQSYPVRLWKNATGIIGKHAIQVFGRGNTATSVPLPKYEVRDCEPQRIVTVTGKVRPNTWSEFRITAALSSPLGIPPANAEKGWRPPPPPPFEPVRYVWTFGDGQTATTAVPAVEHSYEDRPQTTLYSYYLVQVDVHGRDGQVLSGRGSLALINPAFEALAVKGTVALMIALTPRFPQVGPDGKVVQQVRLWHHRPQDVTIERATVTRHFKEGAEHPTEEVNVAGLLGTTMIPPGPAGISTRVTLDTVTESGVFSVTYRLAGKSAEGWPVSGSFSVMQPPPRPTRENSRPVVDPLLKEKIIRARQILGQDTVSDEDLWRLQREGAFADLVVPPGPPVTPPPPVPVDRTRPPTHR